MNLVQQFECVVTLSAVEMGISPKNPQRILNWISKKKRTTRFYLENC